MPSLTATMLYKVELNPEELRLILLALCEAPEPNRERSHELMSALAKQRDAYVSHMLRQVKNESPQE